MRRLSRLMLIILVLCLTYFLTGCWNYRDINQLAIVSGIAIDKGADGKKYDLTVEVVDFSLEGTNSKISPKLLEASGNSIFDAVRNIIKTSPKRLYWGHSMIFIISESLAKDGIVDVLDWISRDNETRSEAYILISREASARDILLKSKQINKPISYNIYRTLHAQKDLSKAPKVEIYKFINMLSSEGVSSILPAISNSTYESEALYEVAGTALFKKDKLVGFIDGDETKYLLFVKDEVKGGLLIEETNLSEKHHSLVLEIKKSSTKLKPDISSGELKMKMDINIQATLAEIATPQLSIDETTIKKLERSSEEALEDNIKVLIKKIQNDYNLDVFGFGRTVKEDMPKLWKSQASNWNVLFKGLKVDVNAKIHIKNTAFTSEPIKLGD